MNSTPPESLGPYRIEATIGSGGMGVVYRAFDQRLERQVALKHLRPGAEIDDNARLRLWHEARAAAAVGHPSIAQIFDILETVDGDWIVMEYIDGPSLAQLLENGALAVGETVGIACDVAEGLAWAHSQGILHRDLKTQNVMLSPVGRAKILDFGLAKRLFDGGASLTVSGAVVGTCRAMSPEQANGFELDERSDLFSFGTLLYESLTGRSPFVGQGPADTLNRVCTHRQAPARALNPEVPEDVSRLVDQLLEKLPELRPANARRVADELTAIARELEEEPSTPERNAPDDAETAAYSTVHQRSPSPAALAGPDSRIDDDSSALDHLTRRGRFRYAAVAVVVAVALAIAALPGSRAVFDRWLESNAAAPARVETADATAARGPRDLYLEGRELLRYGYRKGNSTKAFDLFEAAINLDDRFAPAYAGLSQALHWLNSRNPDPVLLKQAYEHASRAVELNGHLALARVALGVTQSLQGRPEESVEQLREALVLDPLSSDAYRELGNVLVAQHKPAEAKSAYQKARELNPAGWLEHLRLALFYHHQERDHVAAEEAYLRVAELAPDNSSLHSNLAVLYFSQGRYDQAAVQLQRSLEIDPNARIYSNLGTLEFFRGRYRAALGAFEKAIENGANSYLNWGNLADAYRWTPGHKDLARDAYLRATQLARRRLETKPGDVTARSRLALYLAKQGQEEDALAEIAASQAEGVDDPSFLYRCVVVFEVAGRRDRALEVLAMALEAGYSLEEVRRDPELTGLRIDPRYHLLVAPMEEMN